MNRLREILANKVEENGGYGSWNASYAIEYDVSLRHADADVDSVYAYACQKIGTLSPITGLVWAAYQEWGFAQEQMYCALNDDEAYRTYSPLAAARYGLPYHRFPRRYKRKTDECAYYPAELPGWILDKPFENLTFDVTFELAGRGGKHLVIREFEGHSLCISNRDLVQQIRAGQDTPYTNRWCTKLLVMMEEWEQVFTSKNASDEIMYQLAYRLHTDQSERSEAWRERLAKRRAQRAAGRLLQEYTRSMVTPC